MTADLGPGALGLFTTRFGGRSAAPYSEMNLAAGVGDRRDDVAHNRDVVAAELGAPVVYLRQVHSAQVLLDVRGVSAPGEEPTADAVVLTTAEVGAAVLVADCIPVLLASRSGAVAAVHAGRRGLLAGIVPATTAAMAGAGHGVTHAAIGPGICGTCYEVPAQLREQACDQEPALASWTTWGTPALDLRAGVRAQLAAAGVRHVHEHAICTREDRRFYSYRRDGVTGRFAGVVRAVP
ncbi:polyphenol oxidase family protein [Ruania halotolerans]|nr:polyphenol oxidase family protein [Ruania halotolerans]UFU05117.1 polyphenol oxidase family protein [Ruania halotolerans]